jgi:Cu(I)/Ag(I) efflux system membrane fusion protein
MNVRLMIAFVAAAGLGGAYLAYRAGLDEGARRAPDASAAAPAGGSPVDKVDPATGRKVLYWHDPMVPGQRFDRPGKSPFMDMMLVPVYADDAAGTGVGIDPRVAQNLGVRTATVTHGRIAPLLEAAGSVAYDERDAYVVQARAPGYVEKLHVRASLTPVRTGQPLVDLYIPDWVAAQEEFFAARRMSGPGTEALRDAARQRMRLVGMNDAQIESVERDGVLQPRATVRAPAGGVVTELAVREGMAVGAGAPLFRINGVGRVWVHAEIPENRAASVRAGMPVEIRAASSSGPPLDGRVAALLPDVNATTRTVKARIEVDNPGGRLVPGIYATVVFAPEAARETLIVPSEAVIRSGRRNVVYVVGEDGRFRGVDVDVGAEAAGTTEVRAGLRPGQKVVVSGQFLVDSDASLRGATARMAGDAEEAPQADPHAGHGAPGAPQ